jgi:hypothetical protein
MQQELVTVIQQRTGLDEAMAQQVAATVIDFLKTKLPPELAPLLEGGAPDVSTAGGLLGGLFGGRSE